MAIAESSNSPFDVDARFIEQNQKLNSKNVVKREGGPYTKSERDKRQQEVYKLHFEYGYSARKISELMKINRNTINGDIDYWFSKIYKNSSIFNPHAAIIITLERLDMQRTRLREQLDKTKTFQEKLALERLIYEIDCKISYIHNRLAESARAVNDLAVEKLNQWMKKNNREERYMTLFDKLYISKSAHEKISKIIKEDRLHYSP